MRSKKWRLNHKRKKKPYHGPKNCEHGRQGLDARTVEGLPYVNMGCHQRFKCKDCGGSSIFEHGAEGTNARTVEDSELLSVYIAVFSLIARTAEGVRYANIERYDLYECMTSSIGSVEVSPKSTVSVSSIRNTSSSSMAESHKDSMNKNEKRKGEDKGTEACRGVKTTKVLVVGIRKNPGRAVKGLKYKDRSN